MRKAILTACAAAATAAAVIIPSAASASTATATTYKVITISPLHEDTTSASGTGTQADPARGPVWAMDRLREAITVTSAGTAGHYNVKIAVGGSTFAGFADPNTGAPLNSQGKITGSIVYNDVASATAPDITAVPGTQQPNTSLGAVLSELFHGANQPAVSTHYTFNYTPTIDSVDVTGAGDTWTAGTVYSQTG
jgi:hypothetical protein